MAIGYDIHQEVRTDTKTLRAQMDQEYEVFLMRGGVVREIPPGESALKEQPKAPVFRVRRAA